MFVYSQDLKPRDSNTLSHRPSASLLRMAEIHGRGWGKAQRSRVVLSRSVLLWRCLLWLLLLSPFFGINHCRIIFVITMNVFSVSRCPFYLLLSSSFTYNHVYIYIMLFFEIWSWLSLLSLSLSGGSRTQGVNGVNGAVWTGLEMFKMRRAQQSATRLLAFHDRWQVVA